MKRVVALFLLAGLLMGCTPAATQASDVEMSTKVSQLLTGMPTTTNQALLPPTGTSTPLVMTATLPPPEDTPTPEATPTLEPTSEMSETPTPAASTQLAETPTLDLSAVPTVLVTGIAETPTLAPTVVPTATLPGSDPRLTLGSPTYYDGMDSSDGWPTGEDDNSKIDFKDGVMRLTSKTKMDNWRMKWYSLKNFYLEMTVSAEACDNLDHYGMIFRVPNLHKPEEGYLFGVSCEGKYSLRKFDGTIGKHGKMTFMRLWTANEAILKGAGQVNRLGMMAEGKMLTLYINGVKVDQIQDNKYLEGYYGVYIGAKVTENMAIRVDEMSYWLRP